MKASKLKTLILLLTMALYVAACSSTEPQTVIDDSRPDSSSSGRGSGDSPPDTPGDGVKVEVTRAIAGSSAGWVDGSPAEADESYRASAGGEAMEMSAASDAVAEPEFAGTAPPPDSFAASEERLDQNSQLTAGEVDDNEQWDDYLLYLRDYSGAKVLPVDVSERHIIHVTDSAGNPILGAKIEIEQNGATVGRLRTHSDGRAYFFPKALPTADASQPFDLSVTLNGDAERLVISPDGAQREWTMAHPGGDQMPAADRLDVLFLIDATGSMADEIAQIRDNIQQISAQIDALPSQPDVRFGMTVYRDREDAFVSRTFDFTPDVEAFAAGLEAVQADGGGDYPEDLNEGLFQAIHTPEWRVEGTVSLIFLVADAPPHLDYGQQNHYAAEMLEAAERGIKIYPIASSGLDDQGEYIFRQLAQTTGGKFIFLTYGAGGAGTPGTETTHNVEDYTVSALDDLVVRIVEDELAHQTR